MLRRQRWGAATRQNRTTTSGFGGNQGTIFGAWLTSLAGGIGARAVSGGKGGAENPQAS